MAERKEVEGGNAGSVGGDNEGSVGGNGGSVGR